MKESAASNPAGSRLSRLLTFLDHDPENLNLLGDAAMAAFDADAWDQLTTLLHRHENLAPLPPGLVNLNGMAALREGRFEDARSAFSTLVDGGVDDPGVLFNLAWVKAMLGDHQGSAELLGDTVIANVPRSASLKVQMMHHMGQIEDALACGQGLAERYPDDEPLMGALAILAMDADDPALARLYAQKAEHTADGLVVAGSFLLGDNSVEDALFAFDQAIARQQNHGRAWVGRGLALLNKNDLPEACASLDRGATLFGDHLGSWIAAGWAYFIKGEYPASRERFEHALSLDDTFAETHGALAVLDIHNGDMESARRRTQVALRLDRTCFAAALAQSMLKAAGGDAAGADRIRMIALNTPIGPGDQTIAQALSALGLTNGHGRPRKKP